MKEIMTDTFSAINRIVEGKGIEIVPPEAGEVYQILRYNGRYYLIDSLNGLLLDSENIEDIKKEIADIFVAEGYTTVSKEPSITEGIDADNDLSRHYCSVEMFDDEESDNCELPVSHDIEEEENFDDVAMGIMYSYGRIDPANYCEGRFIAYKAGDVEKALDTGIKAIGLKKKLKKSIVERIIAAQIAKDNGIDPDGSIYQSTITTLFCVLDDLDIDHMLLKPYGIMLDYEEYRPWMEYPETYAYEIVDSQEFNKRMERQHE